MIACGFGTAYQGLLRANVSGNDRVLVMGQGPVGQAAIILAKALGAQTIAVDIAEERLEMAKQIGADEVLLGDDNMVENVMKMTGGKGVEVAIDCSGSSIGRHRCLEVARMWGNVVFLGEQGTVTFEPSPLLLHKNLTLHGSWVTSVANMEKLVGLLDRKKIHPSQIITHRFPLRETDKAFEIFATGKNRKSMRLPRDGIRENESPFFSWSMERTDFSAKCKIKKGDEIMDHVENLREWMKNEGYDDVVLSRRDNFTWVSGGAKNAVCTNTEVGIGHYVIRCRKNQAPGGQQ